MIKLEKTQVVGWEAAIRGMRNPKNSWEKSDSFYTCGHSGYPCEECIDHNGCKREAEYRIGPNDHDLMMRLAKGGPVHAKYRRMIVVYVDITAPLYWWKEFDTYKVGTVANSCSTMHKIHERELTMEDFSVEHLIDGNNIIKDEELRDSLDILERYKLEGRILDSGEHDLLTVETDGLIEYLSPLDVMDQYALNTLNYYRDLYIKTKDKKYWWQMIQLLPSSYNQKRTVMLNYEVLSNIYYSPRYNHKLDEWRDFCSWIEGLPYSEIILAKPEKEEITIMVDELDEKLRQKAIEYLKDLSNGQKMANRLLKYAEDER